MYKSDPLPSKKAAKANAAARALLYTSLRPFLIPPHLRERFQHVADAVCPSSEDDVLDPECDWSGSEEY